ncbi:MAG TPA: nucleoside triphosphate pyrophosphohydrolase [Bacillota bacterium]|nr:nucleoside triphosphate pyrophosphohydrolase [Bacillota bacterium]
MKKTIKYDKLIRDRIPEIISADGSRALTEIIDDVGSKRYLDIKLHEELEEYLAEDSVEELADLVEVVYALLNLKGIPIDEFEKLRKEKALKRGGFSKRLLLKEVISR